MATGFVWHELYVWHNTGNLAGVMPYGYPVQPGEHAEHPETKRRFKNLVEASGLLRQMTLIEPRPATDGELLRFHTRAYVEKIRGLNDSLADYAGFLTPMGRGSFDIALLATGGCIEAVDEIMKGTVRNAYALVRPPGHHALADTGMGFCLFANAALAGLHALDVHKLDRIAFVDWDVHHGNGTQAAFWEDPRALTISVHQDRCFPPGSGLLSERGAGRGEGYNINIPLPPGSGTGAYEAVFDRVVVPALRRYKPQLIIVPSGFDAGSWDPLGRMMMTSEGYRGLTRRMMTVADEVCGGRLLLTHEGGYSAPTAPFFGLAICEELSGIRTGVSDPFEPLFAGLGQQELQPHQDAAVKLAEGLLAGIR